MKIFYFAWIREKTGLSEEHVDLPPDVKTVEDLINWQKTRGPQFAAAFENAGTIRTAIDQSHAAPNAPISGANEIAFFPPVTGG